jgi:hypothetical protein
MTTQLPSWVSTYNSYFTNTSPLLTSLSFDDITPANYDEFEATHLQPVLSSINDRIKVNNRTPNSIFFLKSLLMYLLTTNPQAVPIYPTSAQNGLLTKQTSASNCLFTIATINDVPKFIKVVPFDYLHRKDTNDLILIDIITAFIFDYINKRNSDKYDKIRDYLALYQNSFISYYLSKGLVNLTNRSRSRSRILSRLPTTTSQYEYYWDYDFLRYNSNYDEKKTKKCPYHPDYLENVLGMKKSAEWAFYDGYKRCFVYMSDAVTNAVSIEQVFKRHKNKIGICLLKLVDFYYEFLLEMGVEFGYCHNDLHFGNILFQLTAEKVILIDYGRSMFGHFIYGEDNKEINDLLGLEIKKLDLNRFILNCSNVRSYKDLNNEDLGLLDSLCYMNDFTIGESGGRITRYYPYCIFDLITFSCNIYIYLLYFLHQESLANTEPNFFHKFKNSFGLLFSVDDLDSLLRDGTLLTTDNRTYTANEGDEDNYDQLILNYKKIIEKFLNRIKKTSIYFIYRDLFKIVLDGLLLTALLLIFKKTPYVVDSNILHPAFQVNQDVDSKKEIIEFMANIYFTPIDGEDILSSYKHPLSYILKTETTIKPYFSDLNGGFKTGGLFNSKSTNSFEADYLQSLQSIKSKTPIKSSSISSSLSVYKQQSNEVINETYKNYLNLFDFYDKQNYYLPFNYFRKSKLSIILEEQEQEAIGGFKRKNKTKKTKTKVKKLLKSYK